MIQTIRRLTVAGLVIPWFVLASAEPAAACSTPVFRYALERWPPDAYRVAVFHRGPLTEAQQAAVKQLTDVKPHEINVVTRVTDLAAEPNEDMLSLWEAEKSETLPFCCSLRCTRLRKAT